MSQKRIAVFGGTGLTGVHFSIKALEHGHELVIYARNPAKIPQEVASHPSAKVCLGTPSHHFFQSTKL